MEDAEINSRLVAYCSDQAHSSVEKAGLIGLVKIRYIESDDNLSLRGDKLKEAIDADRENGYVPFFVSFSTVSSIYKNRVKNGRKIFEIPTLLSSQRGNPERENSKYIFIYYFEF